ncbi:VanZ family protein [Microvirga terricola]|uniref:VanZ family protein n=1 Tax=Microvirga terricola TaxID=2719797 RepID=A0ABX0V755_9HYPH|nr:VanZ family protein [Microvirga terricola]NIX75685.1 VanZ family protein [Microvirga terricola]
MTIRVFIRWVGWLLVLAVTAFSLLPIQFRPTTEAPANLERIAAFAAIGGAFCLGYPGQRVRIVLLTLAVVGLLEGTQNLVSGRHGRLSDATMKAVGALLGAAGVALIERRISRRSR